jgi:hypothetical protein
MVQAQQIQAAISNGQQLNPQQVQTLQMMMMIQRNQQLLQQQQQQLLANQPTAAAATNPQYLQQQYQLAAAAAAAARSNTDAAVAAARANGSGEEPPAKRQAFDANQQAQLLASHQFRQLHQTGGLSHIPPAQQTALYHSLHLRARQQLGLPALPYVAPTDRGNMRVSIDKRNKNAGDKLFQAVDTTGRDNADEVVRRCEEISRALSARLGKGVHSSEGRFGGTDYDSPVSITQQQMLEACGDTARYLKPYQIVGVNFLMLLHRSQVGGAILADEMVR